ncbi:hypothetical protein [Magnetospirillum sp. UT-4]|uniref:hypothetical protein n=1 Tax=Magnetospirillum sp. UT-4 TaxID=2681467 RepID=UPI00137F31D9|nr:hypothetical protein [Magnetospirillum sp. UT-4]CAA7621997.1 conserved hypothetical protein [Magnetospirillum sp. UT-4]
MYDVDLDADRRYPPLDAMSPGELFDFAARLARSMRHIRVRTRVGEPGETVELDGRLLNRKGVEVY